MIDSWFATTWSCWRWEAADLYLPDKGHDHRHLQDFLKFFIRCTYLAEKFLCFCFCFFFYCSCAGPHQSQASAPSHLLLTFSPGINISLSYIPGGSYATTFIPKPHSCFTRLGIAFEIKKIANLVANTI